MSFFEAEFRAFARAEAKAPLPSDFVLFYGSSSIRLWDTLPQDFPSLTVVNRGFGGSTLRECVDEMGRLILHMHPRAIVLYAGDNDLDHGARPEALVECVEQFMATVEQRMGPLPVVFISIKPSPSRMWNIANIRRANELLEESLGKWKQAHFVNVFPFMLQPDGGPRHDLFTDDALHLNEAGYRLWADNLRERFFALGILT